MDRTYRFLDHGQAKSRLEAFAKTKDAHPSIKEISTAFSGLKAKRAKADYETPQSLFNRRETLDELDQARAAIHLIAELNEEARRLLAIELLLPLIKRDH